MTEENFSIPTRQKADPLFESSVPIQNGSSLATDVKRVSGYAQVSIFALSDQPFTIVVEEAAVVKSDGTGNFAQTQATIASATVAGQEQVVTRIQPFGNFMKMTLANASGSNQTFLSFLAQGLPVS
jgi:hypothetical protein